MQKKQFDLFDIELLTFKTKNVRFIREAVRIQGGHFLMFTLRGLNIDEELHQKAVLIRRLFDLQVLA